MPVNIISLAQLNPGDLFEDCAYHPCLCIAVKGDDVTAISLVDGGYPHSCSISHCGLRKLTVEEAWIWRTKGPQNLDEIQVDSITNKWWLKKWTK